MEFREIHATWLQRKNKEGQTNATAIQVPMGETETPVAFVPQDLPTTHIGVDVPSSALQDIEHLSELQGIDSPSDAFIDVQASTVSSPTFTVSTISDFTPTELGEDIAEEQIPTRHETFYLEDGNVEIVCGRTIFRIHSPIVSFSSSRLRDMLSRSTLLDAPMPEGCHRIVSKDSAEDFAVLLKMIYTPGFPAWGKVLVFTVFASLLRMAAKYGFSDVREQLVDSLKGAYPTKWEAYQAANVLGEDVFGSPKPHPNTVLNLFLEQNVKFAIPFATYRAALGGFSSLISNEPGTVLPRLTLAFTIYGMETIRRVMIQASHSIVYNGNLKVCPQRACALSVGISPMERRMEVLKKICSVMVYKSKDDILSPLPLGGLVCVNCAKLLEDAYSICRERFVWSALPSLLGAGGGRESV
ncbi:hypothetical protein BDM02DRAFT_2982782 [Thelephora ganbajun]|uniref:Uncharacterized protein n=1 Tax=Thelephora ganbajun TaxID=370292 RepID=A0ACB6ZBB6_THEGA|nr:hypothetical protein BDM02DRAFT_2982782 [Thelephora ganbajun]